MNKTQIVQATDNAWQQFERKGELTYEATQDILNAMESMQRRERQILKLMSINAYAGEYHGGMNTNCYVSMELAEMGLTLDGNF